MGCWKLKKKNKFKIEMGYDLNKLMILNWILGRINKKGYKNWSFLIIKNFLLYLKKNNKKIPKNLLNSLLIKVKQNILLFNKKKGTLRFELPRFISIEQGIKKVVEWLIEVAVLKKRNIINSLIEELNNIFFKKGEFWKKKKHILDTLDRNKPFFYLLKKKKKKKCIIIFV